MRLAPCQSDFRYRAAMSTPDFNLLPTLDVLLQEGSVAGAARRLRLSPSAMSRTLARLREATGDPLLVRAGRGLVPTPRAQALRDSVRLLVQQGTEVLRPTETLDLARSLALPLGGALFAALVVLGLVRPGLKALGTPRTTAALPGGQLDALETDELQRPALPAPQNPQDLAPTPEQLRLEEARVLARHRTPHAQLVQSVSPATRAAYLALTQGR